MDRRTEKVLRDARRSEARHRDRTFDASRNQRVVSASKLLLALCREIETRWIAIQRDASDPSPPMARFETEFRRAFGAIKSVQSQDLRLADRGAAREFARAEQALARLRQKIAGALPPDAKTLADLIEQTEASHDLLQHIEAQLTGNPELHQPIDHVMQSPGASLIGVLAIVYLVMKKRLS